VSETERSKVADFAASVVIPKTYNRQRNRRIAEPCLFTTQQPPTALLATAKGVCAELNAQFRASIPEMNRLNRWLNSNVGTKKDYFCERGSDKYVYVSYERAPSWILTRMKQRGFGTTNAASGGWWLAKLRSPKPLTPAQEGAGSTLIEIKLQVWCSPKSGGEIEHKDQYVEFVYALQATMSGVAVPGQVPIDKRD
jgi:hypothetical protein